MYATSSIFPNKIVNLSTKWLNRHNNIKRRKIYNFLCKFILLKMCVLPHYRGVEAAVTVVLHDISPLPSLRMVFYLREFERSRDEPERNNE